MCIRDRFCTGYRLYVATLFNIDLTGALMDDGGGGLTLSLNLRALQTKFKIGHTVICKRRDFSNVAREPMVQCTSNSSNNGQSLLMSYESEISR